MITRFFQVDKFLYRGAKPKPPQFPYLKDLGIKTIVDFSVTGQKSEAKLAQKYGINYVNIPVNPIRKVCDNSIDEFFKITNEAREKNEKVFIHCWRGKDRTGLFAAMYKLQHYLGNFKSCTDEMKHIGYNRRLFPKLYSCLEKFNKTHLT